MGSNLIVKRCFLCRGYTEYYCHSCHKDLCKHCKAIHVIDLDTKHHRVTIYREKFNHVPTHDKCVIHPDRIYKKYCEHCEVPVCDACSDPRPQHHKHTLNDIRTAYQTKRRQHEDKMHCIRSETLYIGLVLLEELRSVVKSDVQTCRSKISRGQYEIRMRGQSMKDIMDCVIASVIFVERSKLRNLIKKIRKIQYRYIVDIQKYENRYEESACRPVQFLRFIIKAAHLPQIQDTPHLTHHYSLSLTPEINIKGLIELLSEVQIIKRGKRQLLAGNELLLTLITPPVLQKSLKVKDTKDYKHISCVTPHRVWVHDEDKLILTDTTNGNTLYSVKDSLQEFLDLGIHTVNNEYELIYIDKNNNIKKLSHDRKTTSTIIKNTDSKWIPWCVYSSPSNGDLLVGMWSKTTVTGKVMRYSNTWQHKQTIQHDNLNHADEHTHRLFAGSGTWGKSTVSVYRHINRHLALIGKFSIMFSNDITFY